MLALRDVKLRAEKPALGLFGCGLGELGCEDDGTGNVAFAIRRDGLLGDLGGGIFLRPQGLGENVCGGEPERAEPEVTLHGHQGLGPTNLSRQ